MDVAPAELAGKVVESLRVTPFILTILIINTIALVGFGYALHQVANAAERRDNILIKCMERSP